MTGSFTIGSAEGSSEEEVSVKVSPLAAGGHNSAPQLFISLVSSVSFHQSRGDGSRLEPPGLRGTFLSEGGVQDIPWGILYVEAW